MAGILFTGHIDYVPPGKTEDNSSLDGCENREPDTIESPRKPFIIARDILNIELQI